MSVLHCEAYNVPKHTKIEINLHNALFLRLYPAFFVLNTGQFPKSAGQMLQNGTHFGRLFNFCVFLQRQTDQKRFQLASHRGFMDLIVNASLVFTAEICTMEANIKDNISNLWA